MAAKAHHRFKHGLARTRVYRIWSDMKSRCYNSNVRQYCDWGGRGIQVCDRWKDFQCFYSDMGEPDENETIERIDVNKDYYRENCVWLDRKLQARNTRRTKLIEYQGKFMTLMEWSQLLEIKRSTLAQRIYVYKWDIPRAFTKSSV